MLPLVSCKHDQRTVLCKCTQKYGMRARHAHRQLHKRVLPPELDQPSSKGENRMIFFLDQNVGQKHVEPSHVMKNDCLNDHWTAAQLRVSPNSRMFIEKNFYQKNQNTATPRKSSKGKTLYSDVQKEKPIPAFPVNGWMDGPTCHLKVTAQIALVTLYSPPPPILQPQLQDVPFTYICRCPQQEVVLIFFTL